MRRKAVIALLPAVLLAILSSCAREPVLYLHRDSLISMDIKVFVADLRTLWDYGTPYDFEKEWVYGWDSQDSHIFGTMGYKDVNEFQLRRYYLGKEPGAPHTSVRAQHVGSKFYKGSFEFGYHDILVWNEIESNPEGQAIRISESLDSVVAFTGQTQMRSLAYPGIFSDKTYNQPEMLFSGYIDGLQITDNPDDYGWNEDYRCYEKSIVMEVQPVTYIYLVQFILHNNNGRITMIQGDSNLSAMAAGVSLNSCRTLTDAVTVNYQTRLKKDVRIPQTGEVVDVIGGKLTTFGICGTNPTKVNTRADLSQDDPRHYLDLNVTFLNGLDSTMVFDVTDIVTERFKGGVITIDLDVDEMEIPTRPGGSGFEAVVKDPNQEDVEIII